MTAWYESLTILDRTFLFCAVVGGTIFLIKFFLMMIGGDSDVDFDADSGDADDGLLWISTFSLAAFAMMFGMGGLTASRQFGAPGWGSTIIATICGILMIIILKKLMKKLMTLHSSGTADINNAVGVEGSVYLTIPAEGQGKVQLVIQGTQKVMTAVSENGDEIKTGEIVTVKGIVNNILKVTKQNN